MPAFRYRAIGPAGELQSGTIEAATEADVVALLQHRGSIPMRAEPAEHGSWFGAVWRAELIRRRGLRRAEVTDIMRELATMLGAGQDLDRALRYLHETATSARTRTVIAGLRDGVRDGSPFATALARYPNDFSRLHIALVRAGEASGQLAPTLTHLAELLERQQRLVSSVTSALIYPCLLVVAAIVSVVLLLTEVLPQFLPLFEQSGAKLPGSTQLLISIGDFVSRDGIFVLAMLVPLAFLVRVALRAPRLRLVVDTWVLRLPIIGTLMREMLAARFTRVLGTLLVNGVSLIPALGIVREAMNNSAVVMVLDNAAASARAGAGLAIPLANARVFPVRMTHLLRLGEENAELGPIALRIADIHEEKTRTIIQRLVALLVPMITILMGLLVAGIVASLLTAMLSLNDLAAG